MNTFIFKAKSSSGEPYNVEFIIDGSIIVRCNCRAGIFGKLCKHKTGLISGDQKLLYDPSERSKLDELIEHVRNSEYSDLDAQLLDAKRAVDTAKKAEAKIKKTIESAFKEGICLNTES